MRRWGHLHTAGVGLTGGLILAGHTYIAVAAALALGAAVGFTARELLRAARRTVAFAAQRTQLAVALADAKVRTERAKATELRTRTRHRRRTKAEQDKALKKAYIDGAIDGGRR